MSAQPATADIIELDTSRIYQPPPKPVAANPILEAEPEAYQPPPNAVLNREPKPKRQRKAKGTGKKPGRPPRAKAPEKDNGFVEPTQPFVATPPHGDAKPNRWFSNLELGDRIWMVCAGVIVGVALSACGYFLWTGVWQ